jgi:hypothetical protein
MDSFVRVTLTEQELEHAALIGAKRYYESVTHSRKDNHGLSPDQVSGLCLHIEGACGEAAVAKWSGQYWGGDTCTFKAGDIGQRVQVRTRSRHDYDLIVREDDHDDHAFILVTGSAPTLVLRGWIWGGAAKLPQFLKAYGGRPAAYFVPQSELRPMRLPQAARNNRLTLGVENNQMEEE